MRNWIKEIPVLRSIAKAVYQTTIAPFKTFPGFEDYWKQRYEAGGNLSAGSYHKLAESKADVPNEFVREEQITTVIEFGCADGNQLKLSDYPSYLGLDVSPQAISQCKRLFSDDGTKTFNVMVEYGGDTVQLALSLDVIYHLIEDEVFDDYMTRLFDSATRFVIVCSSNSDNQEAFQASHVKHREFSRWISDNERDWKQARHIPNKYPHFGNEQSGSFADFYIYGKV